MNDNDEYIKELKEQRNALLINEIEKDQYIQELKERIYTLYMNVIEKDKYIEQLKEQLKTDDSLIWKLKKTINHEY